ncbi:MAG: hypothetical protein WBV82_11565 [Myxococcaceae bacterium]
MKIRIRSLSAALVVTWFLAAIPESLATNYTLWIHGRTARDSTQVGNYEDFSYWGPKSASAGVNKRAVNWDGYSKIADQNVHIRNALDCYCTGENWCYVAVHSAGNLHIGYALSLYGGTRRNKKNAVPNASGVCGDSDGSTQVGWNIKWVDVASGAGGGSELADRGNWTTSEPLVSDLVTTTARALYDHNLTRSRWFYMFAGAKGTFYSGMLPGQDDEAVSYHSSGGVSGSSGGSYCNPGDWWCNDLTMGTNACEGGRAKWSWHTVQFRDDDEAYDHYASGNWEGIVAKVREDVAEHAW